MLAVAAVSAKLRAILLSKMCKIYSFCAALLIPHMTANSAHVGQFCANSAHAELQNSDIPSGHCSCDSIYFHSAIDKKFESLSFIAKLEKVETKISWFLHVSILI